jgi:hypothetical protein
MNRIWHTELDNHPLHLEARYAPDTHEVLLLVDDFPTHREALPHQMWPHAKVVIDVSGHRVAVFVQFTGHQVRFEAAVDGRALDRSESEDELATRLGGRFTPGHFEFEVERYYGLFPLWPRVCTASVLSGATMMAWAAHTTSQNGVVTEGSQVLLILSTTIILSGMGWWWQDLRRTRDLFAYGDSVPAVVVGEAPLRIAVAVDLAMPQRGFFPAVRITAHPDLEIDGVRPVVGDRLVALVRYQDSQNGRHWQDIHMVAAATGTHDLDALRTARTRFAPKEWSRLERWLRAVDAPKAPGLHRLNLPGSGFVSPND